MQQITFENWKQLGLKVGDPILVKSTCSTQLFETTIKSIASDSPNDRQPIRFKHWYDNGSREWIDFRVSWLSYFKLETHRRELCALFQNNDFAGYFYGIESNTIETRNVIPHKILKYSTNQNGERVWKLRGTWITDTQIKYAINPPEQVPVQNAQYMIATNINNCVSIIDQSIYTDVETLKQEMQNLALANPRNKYVAVQLTDIKVSLDLSNPVFKWD